VRQAATYVAITAEQSGAGRKLMDVEEAEIL
jgi:hypothetical protein